MFARLLLALGLASACFVQLVPIAQAQEQYPLKEKFDGLHDSFTQGAVNYTTSNGTWFHAWGWTLQGYLRLYQTTGDQAYLAKFVHHTRGLMLRRNMSPFLPPIWTADMSEDQYLHYSSELALPMSEFVHMIFNDPVLFATPLPNGIWDASFQGFTHGDCALEIAELLLQTTDYLLEEHWLTNTYGVSNSVINWCHRECVSDSCIEQGYDNCSVLCPCKQPAQLNVQADLAATLYFLAATFEFTINVMKQKADHIATYFKSRATYYTGTESRVWYGAPDADGSNAWLLEDVAHGASSIRIPLTSVALHGSEVFSDEEMEQFARTFSRNIWNAQGGFFMPNVHGDLYGNDNTPDVPNYYARAEVLSWMPLELYDLSLPPNDIYTVLSSQAIRLLSDDPEALVEPGFSGTTHHLSGSVQSYYGLAETVKAQWRRECTSLTLYNRDLVYDQDFAAKRILSVVPSSGPNGVLVHSYADPIITDPHFTVREGITSQFRAGAAVVWEPGFEAEYGSQVEAVIDPAGCELVVHMGLQGIEVQANEDKRAQLPPDAFARDQARLLAARVPPSPQTTLRLVPNPSAGLSTLELSLHENAELRWDLHNGLGQRVASSSPVLLTAGTHALPMDAASLAPGTYVLSVWVNGKPEQLRWVLIQH